MLQIEIDYELADKVIIAAIAQSIKDHTEQVQALSGVAEEKLSSWQQEDLRYSKGILLHLNAVYEYYGGNL